MPKIDVTVPIPEERLAEFYTLLGSWLAGEERPGTGRARSQRSDTVSRRSRYAPLYTYLNEQVDAEQDELELDFSEVEQIIGVELPRSAYQHRAWWANTPSHAQANAWVSAGWRVEGVDFEQGTVTLMRMESNHP